MNQTFLLNDFYEVIASQNEENRITASIRLNASHNVFNGHFEQMPVVPGVYQTQIIKELLQQLLDVNLTLTHGDNIKFTSMIIPTQHPELSIEIAYKETESGYTAEARLFREELTFTKFKGTFKLI
ncbi:MAG: 3-hydroxyacyl-ACP dehydratase [Bacteroidota bacterium]|jgi:3-hydroxyacyl-[acyl-carrier-protein] dehydratase|nr:3-hydroxyacyl-ACP dehydratase [Bacteroidota bacterium]